LALQHLPRQAWVAVAKRAQRRLHDAGALLQLLQTGMLVCSQALHLFQKDLL